MSGTPSIETIILGLVDNIRTEMVALNQDLHELEVSFATIGILEEKTATMKENINTLQQRVAHLEELFNSLSAKYLSLQQINESVESLQSDLKKIVTEINDIKIRTQSFDDFLKKQEDEAKDRKSFYVSVILLIIGALITYLLS